MNVIHLNAGTVATYKTKWCQMMIDWPHAFNSKKYAVSMIVGADEVFEAFAGNKWTIQCVMDDFGNLVKVN